MLAEKQVNEPELLYQVFVSKRKAENSWELGSWRGTTLQDISSPFLYLF